MSEYLIKDEENNELDEASSIEDAKLVAGEMLQYLIDDEMIDGAGDYITIYEKIGTLNVFSDEMAQMEYEEECKEEGISPDYSWTIGREFVWNEPEKETNILANCGNCKHCDLFNNLGVMCSRHKFVIGERSNEYTCDDFDLSTFSTIEGFGFRKVGK